MRTFRYQISNHAGHIVTDENGEPKIIYESDSRKELEKYGKLTSDFGKYYGGLLQESLKVMKAAREYIEKNENAKVLINQAVVYRHNNCCFDTVIETVTVI